jgi:hypothetical protein
LVLVDRLDQSVMALALAFLEGFLYFPQLLHLVEAVVVMAALLRLVAVQVVGVLRMALQRLAQRDRDILAEDHITLDQIMVLVVVVDPVPLELLVHQQKAGMAELALHRQLPDHL